MPIGEDWRAGKDGKTNVDTDPYNGETLVEVPMANRADVDEAYAIAKQAQVKWAARTPAERSAVMTKAAAIFDERQGEIIDWLVKESGSTQLKSAMEWGFCRDAAAEAARMPYQLRGSISESDAPPVRRTASTASRSAWCW